jgi:hypothetical protein
MATPDTISIEISERTFAVQELRRQQAEMNRIPEWILAPPFRILDTGRVSCRQGHLFVNALSRFCHICGEAR